MNKHKFQMLDDRRLKRFLSVAGKFSTLVLATALGSYCTYLVNERTSDSQRKTDAMLDVYFGQENWTSSMSPLEFELRQSFSREKFALLADNGSLIKLDRLLASDNHCDGDRWSDPCLELTARQLLIQHEALRGGDSADSASFLRIVRKELKLQRSSLLPATVNRYWVSYPTGLDLNGDDIPSVKSRIVPDAFSRAFPTKKYVILVNLEYEMYPPVQESKYLTCVALVGLTYQPTNGERPSLPRYNVSSFVRVSRASRTAERDCVVQAADNSIDGFLKTPVPVLKEHIDKS